MVGEIAWIRGRATKSVTCQRCGESYSYGVDRLGTGHDDAWFGDAAGVARQDLARQLECAVEPVACIACGWYQDDMVREARRRRGKWFVRVGVVALSLSAVLAVIAIIYALSTSGPWYDSATACAWNPAFALALIGTVAFIVRNLRCANWDPNKDTLWRRKRQPKEKGKLLLEQDHDREHGQAAPAADSAPPTSE